MYRTVFSLLKQMRCHLALVSMLLPGAALGCFCPPQEAGQFLHLAAATAKHPASVTLPANARGILFLFDDYPDALAFGDDGYSIVSVPIPLSAKQFHIREHGSGRSLPARLVRLRVEKQMGKQREGYFLGNAQMQQCSKPANAGLTVCRTLEALGHDLPGREQEAPDNKVKRFALEHGLRDISEEVDAAYGLYRVEARDGFKPGKIYQIEYRDGKRRLKAELRMDRRSLAIDGKAMFTVGTDGAATRENLLVARGGSCDIRATLATQPLRLVLPPAYEPYRPQLLYFMQHQLLQADRRIFTPVGRFASFQYLPALCVTIPYGSSFHGNGRELAIGDCQSPAPRQIKAYAGMLEVEDSLHETAALGITFPAEKPGQCPKMMDEVYPIYFVPAKAA